MTPGDIPARVPIWAPGKEPLPQGLTEEDRPYYEQSKRWEGYTTMAMESCAVKTTMAGGVGTLLSLKSPKKKKDRILTS